MTLYRFTPGVYASSAYKNVAQSPGWIGIRPSLILARVMMDLNNSISEKFEQERLTQGRHQIHPANVRGKA